MLCPSAVTAQERMTELQRFNLAVEIIKHFEGWHTVRNYPYYLKTNVIQSDIRNDSGYEKVAVNTNGISCDNNRCTKASFFPPSQRLFRQKVVSLPLQTIKVSSRFGYRTDPFTKRGRFHSGIDLRASVGTETYAMLAGKIEMVGRDKSRGNYVMIKHDDYIVTYCHLSKVLVRQGQIVEPGETVGLVGSTGRSTGPHLHLTLRRGKQLLNPQILLDCIRRILEKDTGAQTSACMRAEAL